MKRCKICGRSRHRAEDLRVALSVMREDLDSVVRDVGNGGTAMLADFALARIAATWECVRLEVQMLRGIEDAVASLEKEAL